MDAAIAETHISMVFFVGDRAYKLKKPVRFGFIDLSTRERREAICHREVELNRRLAPDVYLGVADVRGPDGAVCDHLVVMRRMPADARLSALLAFPRAPDELRRIARAVAAFHASAATGPHIDAEATRDAVREKWRANLRETARFTGTILDRGDVHRVAELSGRFLDGREPLFDHRIAHGRIRDGHGDLLADDIFCLPDGPRILDCIEFDDALRYGDVLADVAFLAMDLERLGRRDLAQMFLAHYREFSGDTAPDPLVYHYVAARAFIRAKVAAIRAEQGDQAAAAEAGLLLGMAIAHLERARVRLVLVGGMPGSGKTTVAAGLSDRLRWTVLRSDEVRKDLAGIGHAERSLAAYNEGIYTPAFTDATYSELLARAGRTLRMGESVVLDASWSRRRWRDEAAAVAKRTSSDLVQMRCVAPVALAVERVGRRMIGAPDPSDATPEVVEAMAAATDPWPAAAAIGTEGSPDDAIERAIGVVT